MAFGFSKTRYSPLAVDFGADSIKLLQILPGQPPQLAAAAAEVIPVDARKDAQARDEFIVDALRRLLKRQPFRGRRAICSLPAFQAVVQHLELPRSEGEQFQLELENQLRQRLDIDPRRMVVRHIPIGSAKRQSQQMEVLCLAAPRDVVMRYINIARQAKLDVVGMHSEPLSLCRAFEHAGPMDGKTVCYVDIGAASTKVVIAEAGQLKFAKTIHAAGDQITRQFAAMNRIDFDEARKLRLAEAAGGGPNEASAHERAMAGAAVAEVGASGPTGIPALDAQQAAAPQAVPTASDPAADTIETLTDEIQLCLRYYQRLYPGMPVDRLVFLGGEARHVSTCQGIARSLRIAAQLGDPLASVTRVAGQAGEGVDLDQPQPGWAVPFGLCMSEANL